MKQLQNQWEKTFQRKLPHILQAFSKSGNNLLKDFHSVIESRCREKSHGLARIDMLGAGLRNYEHVFNDASAATIAYINEQQRDHNRAFVPVVTDAMQPAYEQCNDESGIGSYKRMKGHMERFVDEHKTAMFQQACQEVRMRLGAMCEDVHKAMLGRVEGVFVNMRRDYMSLIGGVEVGQVQIPLGVRATKRELDEVISQMDEEFKKVAEADLEELKAGDGDGEQADEEVVEGEDRDEKDELDFDDDGEEQEEDEQADEEPVAEPAEPVDEE